MTMEIDEIDRVRIESDRFRAMKRFLMGELKLNLVIFEQHAKNKKEENRLSLMIRLYERINEETFLLSQFFGVDCEIVSEIALDKCFR